MGDKTGIQWTDATWNPVRGCRRVSEGCRNCYAETMAARFCGPGQPYEGLAVRSPARWTGTARFIAEKLPQPLRWTKPRRVFVNSMSDLFHEDLTNEQIAAVFGVMAACPQHTFQVLTKRPARMVEWFRWIEEQDDAAAGTPCKAEICGIEATNHGADVDVMGLRSAWPLPNVHLGVSVEDQAAADARIPLLLQCPADVYAVSLEPMLGRVDLRRYLRPAPGLACECTNDAPRGYRCTKQIVRCRAGLRRIDWVIVGGESGPGARPCDVAWIRDVVEQCREAGAPVFVKQLGAVPVLAEAVLDEWPDHVRFTGHVSQTGRVLLRSKQGGDIDEWAADLRVRQFPEAPRD